MVLIDRNKPKSCGHCWYDKICHRWKTQNWGSPPPTDCPLKELPQDYLKWLAFVQTNITAEPTEEET